MFFSKLPDDLAGFKALPQADMSTPFETAAMTVVALTYYSFNKTLCLDMLNYLRGPRPLSEMEKQFIADRFRDKDYVPRSYYDGATPENNYEPAEPYTITVSDNPYSYQDEGYATLRLKSGGADSLRQVKLCLAKDGKWYLWDQMLLADIRVPAEQDPANPAESHVWNLLQTDDGPIYVDLTWYNSREPDTYNSYRDGWFGYLMMTEEKLHDYGYIRYADISQ